MNQNNRDQIINIFQDIERQDYIKSWFIYDLEIWPIIKEILYFQAIRKASKLDLLKITIRNFLNDIKRKQKVESLNFSKKDILFNGYKAMRINLNNESHNKHFDPMMDHLETQNMSSALIEFVELNNKNCYRSDRLIEGCIYVKNSASKVSLSDLKKLKHLDDLILKISKKFRLNEKYIYNRIKLNTNIALNWSDFYSEIIKKTQPKVIFTLSYYSAPCYGLIFAAKQNKVPVIDVQHGGQGNLHFAYNYNSKLKNLNLLPDLFWVWDKASYNLINKWASKDKVILGGNPSINNIEETNPIPQLIQPDDILILYTLQTTITPYVPNFIMHAIKSSPNHYKWWFRLHPRMKENEKQIVYNTLKKKGVYDRVNFKDANEVSLNNILKYTLVHISSFSGSVTEAALLNVPLNITFSDMGKESFKDLIDEGKVYFSKFENNQSLNELISKHNFDLNINANHIDPFEQLDALLNNFQS